MTSSFIDVGPLLLPPREPPPWAVLAIDVLSLVLPLLAGALAVWAGIEALRHSDDFAALLGIAGGVSSALGVIFTGLSSRIRDGRLSLARAIGQLGLDTADRANAQTPGNFGF